MRVVYLLVGVFIGVSGSTIAATYGDRAGPATDTGPVTPFTQRDPRFQAGMEHLSRAAQLLDEVRVQVELARQKWQIPGFRYDLLDSDVAHIQQRLQPVLFVREKRMEYQTLIPSGDYLAPREAASDYPGSVNNPDQE